MMESELGGQSTEQPSNRFLSSLEHNFFSKKRPETPEETPPPDHPANQKSILQTIAGGAYSLCRSFYDHPRSQNGYAGKSGLFGSKTRPQTPLQDLTDVLVSQTGRTGESQDRKLGMESGRRGTDSRERNSEKTVQIRLRKEVQGKVLCGLRVWDPPDHRHRKTFIDLTGGGLPGSQLSVSRKLVIARRPFDSVRKERLRKFTLKLDALLASWRRIGFFQIRKRASTVQFLHKRLSILLEALRNRKRRTLQRLRLFARYAPSLIRKFI